jgi:single-stranded-DNA-specific exonuclease
LPPAYAIVNPNRQDESTDFGYLCAAGVVFLYLVATTTILRNRGIKTPDLMQSLDLVALATVADVVPLVGLNRAFVKQGLKVVRSRSRTGLKILADLSKINSPIDETHLAFVLGPRINAGGRIGDASLGAKLLSETSNTEAELLASKLDSLNNQRQVICSQVEDEAITQVEKKSLKTPIIYVHEEGWHPGVLGIVASRIKEKTNRPSFVISFSGQTGKGSGRSIPGIDLGSLMQRLVYEGLIEKGGGHAMAAGITLSRKQLIPAFERLMELVAFKSSKISSESDYFIDGILMPEAATLELVETLEKVGPFGSGAPDPIFAFPDQNIVFSKRVGTDHLKIIFSDDNKNQIDAICFKAFNSSLGKELQNNLGKKFHIIGKIGKNTWQGRQKVQVIIEDAIEVQK